MSELRAFPLPISNLTTHVLLAEAAEHAQSLSPDPKNVGMRIAEARTAASDLAHEARSRRTPEQRRQLARANALVAGLLSIGTSFPYAASVPALIYAANALAALGDEFAMRGQADDALSSFMDALDLTRAYRAMTGAQNLDSTIYSLAARAAEVAGAVGARQQLSAYDVLASFDANVTQPFSPLMSDGDLAAPRAFAIGFLLRAAAQYPTDPGARAYLERLLAEVEELAPRIRPDSQGAADAFDSMIRQDAERARIWLGTAREPGFRWVTSPTEREDSTES